MWNGSQLPNLYSTKWGGTAKSPTRSWKCSALQRCAFEWQAKISEQMNKWLLIPPSSLWSARRAMTLPMRCASPRQLGTPCSTAKFKIPTEMLRTLSRGFLTATSLDLCWAVPEAKTPSWAKDSTQACHNCQLSRMKLDSPQSYRNSRRSSWYLPTRHSLKKKVQIWFNSKVWN